MIVLNKIYFFYEFELVLRVIVKFGWIRGIGSLGVLVVGFFAGLFEFF